MRQNRVSGFVRNDLPAEISMSNVGRNHMFQTLCQQSSATLTARKGGKPPFGSTALDLQLQWKRTLATLASPVYKMHEAASV